MNTEDQRAHSQLAVGSKSYPEWCMVV